MRTLLLLLLLAAVAASAFIASQLSPADERPEAAARPAAVAPAAEPAGAPQATTSVALVEAPAQEEPAAAPSGPRTLDGTVFDRFDQPVRGARVWLLEPDQVHPPASAAFEEYVTGMTSSKGVFSLTLPDEGTYRLAVGPPGQQRVAPSEPMSLADRPRAAVVVPGGTAVRVRFDQPPLFDDDVTLELVTLRESDDAAEFFDRRNRASSGGRGGRSGFGNMTGEQREAMRERLESMSDEERRAAIEELRQGGGGRGGGRGGGGGDAGESRQRRGGGGDGAREVAFVQDEQQDRGDRRGLRDQAGRRGGRGRDRGEDGAAFDPDQPREIWRQAARHALAEEDLERGYVDLLGVPAGRTARLNLRVGRRQVYEGAGRFTVAADIQVDVRVLPLSAEAADGLAYLVTTSPLGADAPGVGVRWDR